MSFEDLSKALEIVAQSNPGFEANAEEVNLDIDAQVSFKFHPQVVFIFIHTVIRQHALVLIELSNSFPE